ncbi:MAG: sugar ABC transporter ATP-binding protein, partial [Verrucomicrobiota bacterium]
ENGELELNGSGYISTSMRFAPDAGVVMVLQELNVLPTLTIAENLFLSRLPSRGGFIQHRNLRESAAEALARVGLEHLDPDRSAASLGVGQQQLVEIAGALSQDARILILDEPSAALTGPEVETLFENMKRLREEGVAIIYISHRMEEIDQIADRVTVLRDGRRVATHRVGEVAAQQLIREMSGAELAERSHRGGCRGFDEIGLSVDRLHSEGNFQSISFEAYRGEKLGIAGLVGAGRTELLRGIFGADAVDGGEVAVGGESPTTPRSPARSVERGLALIPEDRKQDGLLLDKSIGLNATLNRVESYSKQGWIDQSQVDSAATSVAERLQLKYENVNQSAAELSGGNQQKVVIARWLLRDSEVFLFDEPTRGVDVAAKEAIYNLLDELTEAAKTVVVVSSDFRELMKVCDRILVMSNGRLTGEFGPEDWSQEVLTEAAFAGFSTMAQA